MSDEGTPFTLDESRLTQPVVETWQRLQRLGLSKAQIHDALQPMIALVDHYKNKSGESARAEPRTVVIRRQHVA